MPSRPRISLKRRSTCATILLLEIDCRMLVNSADGVEVFQPLIRRDAIRMQVIEHQISNANAHVPTVLGNRRLTSIITQANHEIAACLASNFDQSSTVPSGLQRLLDILNTFLALKNTKSACRL